MRLINAETLRLEDFTMCPAPSRPPYAILSHTWGAQEVLFADMDDLPATQKAKPEGFDKIRYSCEQALRDGYAYAWIDTCCIDKSSSAELSEAINSMYQWYRESAVCYVYLPDVPGHKPDLSSDYTQLHGTGIAESLDFSSMAPETLQLVNSQWFTRGWTLQELLAPRHLEFYGQSWVPIGTLGDETLEYLVSYKTRISLEVLRHELDLSHVSIAKRMSWASSRQTTREEDQAYSLLGIFGVNLPLLYGEGSRAFRRLQEEISKASGDHSILAWKRPFATPDDKTDLIFASHISQFSDCTYISQRSLSLNHSTTTRDHRSYKLTKDGLTIDLRFVIHDGVYGLLDCYDERASDKLIALRLAPLEFRRVKNCSRFGINARVLLTVKGTPHAEPRRITLSNRIEVTEDRVRVRFFDKRTLISPSERKRWKFKVREVYPPHAWDPTAMTCRASTAVGMTKEEFREFQQTVDEKLYEPVLSTNGLVVDIIHTASEDGTEGGEDTYWPVAVLFSYAADSGATGLRPSSYGEVSLQDATEKTLQEHCEKPLSSTAVGAKAGLRVLALENLPPNGPGLGVEILSSDPYPIVALSLLRPLPLRLRYTWWVITLCVPVVVAIFWFVVLFIRDYFPWQRIVVSEWDISDLRAMLDHNQREGEQTGSGSFLTKRKLKGSGRNVIFSQMNRMVLEVSNGEANGREQESIVKGLAAFAKAPKEGTDV